MLIFNTNLSRLLRFTTIPMLVVLGLVFLLPGKALAVTNGKIVYFVAGPGGGDVYTMNPDGSDSYNVSSDGLSGYGSISPDGSKIAYMNLASGYYVALINSDGTSKQTDFVEGYYPGWSSNGKVVYYDPDFILTRANIDGTGIQSTGWSPMLGGGSIMGSIGRLTAQK